MTQTHILCVCSCVTHIRHMSHFVMFHVMIPNHTRTHAHMHTCTHTHLAPTGVFCGDANEVAHFGPVHMLQDVTFHPWEGRGQGLWGRQTAHVREQGAGRSNHRSKPLPLVHILKIHTHAHTHTHTHTQYVKICWKLKVDSITHSS